MPKIEYIFIKVIRGESSFVDFIVFLQKDEPKQKDEPFLIIEETKTTDKEVNIKSVFDGDQTSSEKDIDDSPSNSNLKKSISENIKKQ